MTVKDIIDHVDNVKPNSYDLETKLLWLNEVEGRCLTDVHKKEVTDLNLLKSDTDELVIPYMFATAYIYYIIAMIDFLCGEFDKYRASSSAYNKVMSDYAKFVIRGGSV